MAELLFKTVSYKLRKLVEDIAIGEIGLPDIQRPFVWPPTKVRELFDSMYRGYPIGSLLFWENPVDAGEARAIGAEGKQKVPSLLIVDGQQRLTAVFAVVKGVPVIDKHFKPIRLRIAFRPLDERFEVTNAAIDRSPEWIADIGEVWREGTYSFIRRYLDRIRETRSLPPEEEDRIARAIDRLAKIDEYTITALELSAQVDEGEVAEIFVRVNSQGKRLNQADFLLTLMSVYWEEGRKALEAFSRQTRVPAASGPSPFNPYWQPLPDRLLRVAVAAAFRRARLEHVYSLLRGKNLQTGTFDPEARRRQFAALEKAQERVLNLTNWHEFLKAVHYAGFLGRHMISSEMALVFSFALWLIGRHDVGVDPFTLRRAVARWFFMSALTSRYSTSPESRMEQDLAELREAQTPEAFLAALERQIASQLTRDYWNVTLPSELSAAGPKGPEQLAFFAAQVILKAPALFSNLSVAELLDPYQKGKKRALERHHLFPRAFLKKLGYDDRLINQAANFALVEWADNLAIGDRPPKEYVPGLEARFRPEEIERMYELHALWPGWYEMDYPAFLEERRKRMAGVIRRGFEALVG